MCLHTFVTLINHGGVIEGKESSSLITEVGLSYLSERVVISWGVSELGVVTVKLQTDTI